MNNTRTALIRLPIAAIPYAALIADPHLTADNPDPVTARAIIALSLSQTVTRGKGLSHVVTIDPEAAGIVWRRCLAIEGDPAQSKRMRAALRDVVARINIEVKAAGYTYPSTTQLPQRRTVAVPVFDGEERNNLAAIPNGKNWTGSPFEYAVFGGPGEPTRTAADMRIAVADLIERYLALYPFDVRVDQPEIVIAADMITRDHYAVPGPVAITRAHLRKYVDVVHALD